MPVLSGQIALPLPWPEESVASDFLVSDANARAVRHLRHRALWPVMATVLTGPRKSGRSLIGRIFAAQSGGILIDDADRRPEEELFHAWNAAQAERRPLLMIADRPPPGWAIALPDLRSRLAATPAVAIAEPDAELATPLFEKLMGQRGLATPPAVIAFVLARIERSYLALWRAADAIDDFAIANRRALTVPLAREALEAARLIDERPRIG